MVRWLRVRSLIPVICTAAFAMPRAAGADIVGPVQSLNEFVASAITPDGRAVILATVALPEPGFRAFFGLPEGETTWRFRLLPIYEGCRATNFYLSEDASKALIAFSAGTPIVADLTHRVQELPPRFDDATVHYSNRRSYGIANGHALEFSDTKLYTPNASAKPCDPAASDTSALAGRTKRLSPATRDLAVASPDAELCRTHAIGIATHGTTVFIKAEDGTLCMADTASSPVTLRRATKADPASFLVEGHDGVFLVVRGSDGQYDLQTPAMGTVVASHVSTTAVVAALHAIERDGGHTTVSTTAASLGLALQKQSVEFLESNGITDRNLVWQSFRYLTPNDALYAPVIEFAPGEPTVTSDVNIWKTLDKAAQATGRLQSVQWDRRKALELAAYERLGLVGDDCNIYVRSRSYAGSWLHEYWLYYPFDIGQGSHYHDTEHVFVEVDKLGGTVRQVIGAGHGIFASNNIFRANSPAIDPVTLPLFAMVESGKHASSPDINGDGVFTIGKDVNIFRDKAKVWGIRDSTAMTDANLRAYDSTMTLPRRIEDRRPPRPASGEPFENLFSDAPGWYAGSACNITPFPQPVSSCTSKHWNWGDFATEYGPTAECAVASLNEEPDAGMATKILKSSYSPTHFVRYGITAIGRQDGEAAKVHEWLHSLGGAAELSVLPFLPDVLKAPGRVSFDALFHDDWIRPSANNRLAGFRLQYERLVSNLSGFYIGDSVLKAEDSSANSALFAGDYHHWLNLGTTFEIAPFPHLNLNAGVGLIYTNAHGLSWETRILAAWLPSLDAQFGIRKKTATSY